MVKGVSRRVIVVKPQHTNAFEQAIFIMRDNHGEKQDILREACAVAESYVRTDLRRRAFRRYTCRQLVAAAIAGAGGASILWVVGMLLW